ncbi:flagellar protein FlaG [Kineothrix sp. MB12-C1]|uniref:flagellar protein FlaG n=1 Tax=Kineothrix sp. MB12-C1 TaxID=3070215 RepID=UPI0027D2BE06|nr:flagellar protein FlaG [Kineothrix sp. MB12-C1]WMC93889.1 flagellar protein FlaG [Kineothrix sp. MB12-C1]
MAMEPVGNIRNIQTQMAQSVTEPRSVTENKEVFSSETSANISTSVKTDNQNADVDSREARQSDSEKVKKAVEQLNKKMPHSEAVFGIHEGTNRVMIKIVDKDTKELIKEYPPEETLDMIAKVWELAGILVDEKR